MWLKTGLLLAVLSWSLDGGSSQTVGQVLGDALNALRSGQTSLFQTLLPGVSPVSFVATAAAKAMFWRGNNQTVGGVFKQEFERVARDTVLKNVSQPCFNAFVFSLTSVTGLLTGSFPIDVANMFDASGKTTSGSMRGAVMRKGNYHQCVKVRLAKELTESIEGLEEGFVGKFCQVDAEYGLAGPDEDAHCERVPDGSDEGFRLTEDACPARQDYAEEQIYPPKRRKPYKIALCVPSVCTVEDVHGLFNRISEMHKKDLHIRDVQCRLQSQNTMSAWSICVICVCVLLAIAVLAATAYDVWLGFRAADDAGVDNEKRANPSNPHQPGMLGRSLLCFAVQRNLGHILNHQPDADEDVLPAVNGVRSLTLLWVTFTNVLLIAKDRPWVNYVGLLEDLRKWPMQLFLNGRFAADSSFCIGGILAAYLMLKRLNAQPGHRNAIGLHYLHRYIRLTPALLLVMMLASGVYPLSADGPDWIPGDRYEDGCRQHWWKGLLFVNNFFNGSESCPPVSWYLATDMQLHLLAPFLVYPLHSSPRVGLPLLGLALLTFAVIPGLITVLEGLPYFTGRLFYLDPLHEQYTSHLLMQPWSHASPFLIGILVGYLLHRSGKRAAMGPGLVAVGWLAAVAVKAVIVFGFHPYIDGTSEMSTVAGILYTTLTPSLWAAATGWIIFACATNNGGCIGYFLSWGVYDVVARVSYCAYLINALAISHFLLSRADSFYYDVCSLMLIFTGAAAFIVAGAIILSTLIERPFMELENLWFKNNARAVEDARILRDRKNS